MRNLTRPFCNNHNTGDHVLKCLFVIPLIIVTSIPATAAAATGGCVAFRDVTVVSTEVEHLLANQTVLVRADRIERVAPSVIGNSSLMTLFQNLPVIQPQSGKRYASSYWCIPVHLALTAEVAGWHDSATRHKPTEERSRDTLANSLPCRADRLSATKAR